MKHFSLVLFAVVLLQNILPAQTPGFQWAAAVNNGQQHATAIMSDTSGNVFTCGYFGQTVDFDPGAGTTNLTANGSQDGFIMKQDAAGNFLWVLPIGGAGADICTSLDIDAAGNLFLTGDFRNVVDFDPGAGTFTMATNASSIINMYVLKLDNNGLFQWAKRVGDGVENLPSPAGIVLDPTGNIYTCGVYKDTTDFDPSASTFTMGSTGTTAFILKLDPAGNFGWVKQIPAMSAVTLDTDASGNVIASGIFTATVDFDPGAATFNMSSLGLHDAYIVKLSGTGNFLWAKQIGGTGGDIITSLKIDCVGNIVSTGTFSTNLRANPASTVTTFTAYGAHNDVFVSKLDAAGNYVWSQQIGGQDADQPFALAVDNAGEIYITGLYAGAITGTGTADFDPSPATQTITSKGSGDIFIMKLTAAGGYHWAYGMGGNLVETGYGLYVDHKYNIYTAGDFFGTVDFDPFTPVVNLTSNGNPYGVYILKFNQPPTLAPVNTTPAGFGGQKTCVNLSSTLTAVGSGTLHWFTTNSSTTTIFTGSAYVTPPLTKDTTFYVYSMNLCGMPTGKTPVSVTVNPLPLITISMNKPSVCAGEPLILTANGGTSYKWFNAKITATNSVIMPTVATVYSVVGTNSNSCSGNATITLTPANCSGINELPFDSGISIYPNPASDQVMIFANETIELLISNDLGQHVKTLHAVKDESINVSLDLKPGIYYIHSRGTQMSKGRKLVIIE